MREIVFYHWVDTRRYNIKLVKLIVTGWVGLSSDLEAVFTLMISVLEPLYSTRSVFKGRLSVLLSKVSQHGSDGRDCQSICCIVGTLQLP